MSQVTKSSDGSENNKNASNISVLKPALAAVGEESKKDAQNNNEASGEGKAPQKKASAKARLAASARKTSSSPKTQESKKQEAKKSEEKKSQTKKSEKSNSASAAPKKQKETPNKAQAKASSVKEKSSEKKSNDVNNPFESIFSGASDQAKKAQEKQRAYQHEAIASLEKMAKDAAKITQSLFAIAKETTEALAESGAAAAKDIEKFTKNVASLVEEIAGEANNASREALKAKDIRDAVRIQDNAARKNVARKIDAAIALNKAAADSASKTFEPLQKRLKKSAEAVADVLFPQQK